MEVIGMNTTLRDLDMPMTPAVLLFGADALSAAPIPAIPAIPPVRTGDVPAIPPVRTGDVPAIPPVRTGDVPARPERSEQPTVPATGPTAGQSHADATGGFGGRADLAVATHRVRGIDQRLTNRQKYVLGSPPHHGCVV
jgi:hypothetical protein